MHAWRNLKVVLAYLVRTYQVLANRVTVRIPWVTRNAKLVGRSRNRETL